MKFKINNNLSITQKSRFLGRKFEKYIFTSNFVKLAFNPVGLQVIHYLIQYKYKGNQRKLLSQDIHVI